MIPHFFYFSICTEKRGAAPFLYVFLSFGYGTTSKKKKKEKYNNISIENDKLTHSFIESLIQNKIQKVIVA